MALFLGGALVIGGASVGMVACSSSSSGNNGGGGGDDGGTTDSSNGGHDSATTDSGGGGQDTGTGDDGGSDAAACKTAPHLHQSDAGSIFCGYQPDGGPAFDCPTGQQCCLGGKVGSSFAPQQCTTWGGTCDNPSPDKGIHIECNQASDCVANGKPAGTPCCLAGAAMAAVDPGCPSTNLTIKNGNSMLCEPGDGGSASQVGSCAAGETQVCTSDMDCPSGQHCIAARWKLYQIGFCQ